jgi:glycosyltransferase involved in cell wall biosynthesis
MSARGPRVAIGVPLYNGADHIATAIESLLAQTFGDFGLVLVDDCSTDETSALAARYAAEDERVLFVPGEERQGIIRNWRRAYRLALERFPSAEYFAWASDHDLWRPGWLEALVERLDAAPGAVLAYPLSPRISGTGEVIKEPWRFSTEGVERPASRLWKTCMGMRAGSMVYGLYRRSVLERLRVYRWVREPDNLLMAELSVQGEFHQIPEVLWERRFGGIANRRRQLDSLFLGRPPWYAQLSPWIEHAGLIFWRYVLSGDRPVRNRLRGLGLWLEFVIAMMLAIARRWNRKRFYGATKRVKVLARMRKRATRRLRQWRESV